MSKTTHSYLLAMLLGAGIGCGDDAQTGPTGATLKQITSTCQTYCEKARVCDDEVAVATCSADCRDRMSDCMADEQVEALDDLESCARDACDDFKLCRVGADLQCKFGL